MEEEYGWDYYLGMLVVILLFASFYWFVVDSPEQREGRALMEAGSKGKQGDGSSCFNIESRRRGILVQAMTYSSGINFAVCPNAKNYHI